MQHRCYAVLPIYFKFRIKATSNTHEQRGTNPGCHVVFGTKVCTLAPNICGPSVRDLQHVALQAFRILSLVPDSWKICGTMRMITRTSGRFDVLLFFSLIQEFAVFSTLAQGMVIIYWPFASPCEANWTIQQNTREKRGQTKFRKRIASEHFEQKMYQQFPLLDITEVPLEHNFLDLNYFKEITNPVGELQKIFLLNKS